MFARFHIYLLLLLFFLSVVSPAHGWDKASHHVPIEDPVYLSIDILVAHSLVDSPFIGHRPFSLEQVKRLLNTAWVKYQKVKNNEGSFKAGNVAFFDALFDELQDAYEFQPESSSKNISIKLIDHADAKLVFLNSPTRNVFGPNILANQNSLVNFQNGNHVEDGLQFALESSHWLSIDSFFSLKVSPRVQFELYNQYQSEEQAVYLKELYGSFALWNHQLDIGRRPMQWGQGKQGGYMFSNHARPLDQIHLSNQEPWKTKYIGDIKYSFFFGGLGPEQVNTYPYVTGGKVSIKPHRFVELAIARAIEFGGNGAPSGSFMDIFADYFGARSEGEFAGTAANLTNSISGFEFRVFVPPLAKSWIYAEFYFDDFNLSHMIRSLQQDSAITMGIYFPALNPKKHSSLRLEAKKTTAIMYKHNIWQDGWSQNRFLLGDPLGPDAEAISVSYSQLFISNLQTTFDFYFERIDSDIYVASASEGRSLSVNGSPEWRTRFLVTNQYQINPNLSAMLLVGYENVANFNFVDNATVNNFVVQAGVSVDFGNKFNLKY
jgi:hypothetical protein